MLFQQDGERKEDKKCFPTCHYRHFLLLLITINRCISISSWRVDVICVYGLCAWDCDNVTWSRLSDFANVFFLCHFYIVCSCVCNALLRDVNRNETISEATAGGVATTTTTEFRWIKSVKIGARFSFTVLKHDRWLLFMRFEYLHVPHCSLSLSPVHSAFVYEIYSQSELSRSDKNVIHAYCALRLNDFCDDLRFVCCRWYCRLLRWCDLCHIWDHFPFTSSSRFRFKRRRRRRCSVQST